MPTRKRFDSMSARDTGLEYLLRRLDRLEGNPGLVARDTRRTGTGGGGVDPTFLVAASDASPGMRAAADWVCTGSGDQVEIQAAFNALPVAGGRVQLSEGTFSITSTVTIPVEAELAGVGNSTVLAMNAASYGLNLGANCTVRNLKVDLSGESGGSRHGIFATGGSSRIESCQFIGMRTSGQDELTYIGAGSSSEPTTVVSCRFSDIGGATSYGYALDGGRVIVDSCTLDGATTGIRMATYIGAGNLQMSNCYVRNCDVWVSNSSGAIIQGCVFTTTGLGTRARVRLGNVGEVTISGCHFEQGGSDAAISSMFDEQWVSVTIDGNQFYSNGGLIDFGSGNMYGIVVSNNYVVGESAEITYDSGALARVVEDVSIRNNQFGDTGAAVETVIHFVGTNLHLNNVVIANNELLSNDAVARPMIDLQFTRDWDNNGQGIRITDNLIEHYADVSGEAIRVRGRTGATHGHVVVAGNQFRAAGKGVLIDNVRDVVVSNNVQGISDDDGFSNASRSNQLTISGADTAVVDGNKWIAGEAGDDAGTGAVISVDASRSGAVRNNDIWGKEVGAMNTALKYSAGLVESGNVYHGLHSLQTGSVLTNGIVGQASGSGGTASVGFTGTATGAVV